MTDISVTISDDPVSVSVSNAPGPAGASSFFQGMAAAWPPSASPTAGWIWTLPDPLPAGTPAGYQPGYGAQWDGTAWTNIGPVRGPAGPAGPQGVAGSAGSPGVAGPQGPQGDPGPAGPAGANGSPGATGPSGAAGVAGPQGPAGVAGAVGPAGSSGVISVSAPLTNSGTSSAAVLGITVGTTAGTVAEGNDSRLSDARTPTAHNHSGSDITTGTVAAARLGAHASTHQTGGADAVASVVVTPTSLTADTNDWAIGTGDVFRVAGTAARNVTGIAAGTSGLAILLVNVGSFALTLKHQSASSTAANRITVPWAGDCVIPASGGAVVLVYDATSSLWRIV